VVETLGLECALPSGLLWGYGTEWDPGKT
jgi:hypothetical protein